MIKLSTLLALLLFSLHASAQENRCKALAALDNQMDPSQCVCGSPLKNVTATLPAGTRLIAACSLRWPDTGPIDISKTQVSFDRYTNGNLPEGVLYLAGELTLSGPIVIEEHPEGNDVRFVPPWKFSSDGPLLLQKMTSNFYLADEASRSVAREAIGARKCSTADVTLHLRGFQVAIGGNDDGTTTPLKPRLLQRSPLRDCEAQPGQ